MLPKEATPVRRNLVDPAHIGSETELGVYEH